MSSPGTVTDDIVAIADDVTILKTSRGTAIDAVKRLYAMTPQGDNVTLR